MVFGNVPKLHALVGLLAATAAFPAGCSNDDFEGCEASRTCKPKNTGGASGTGTGGGGEGGNDTGGTSGGGGASGASGTSGSGTGHSGEAGATDGGHGGAGDDTVRPTIVSMTPDDGDTDVERDVEITVTFSEPIDERTVTRRSVVLTGPDGDVTGTFGVDGRAVTFVAEKPLYLLGDYTFTIGDAVADLAGNTMGEEASVGWKVRDGRWSEPVYPFGTSMHRVVTRFQRNFLGDVVLGIELTPTGDSVFGAVYSASENRWTAATALRTMAGARYYAAFGAAIDPNRRAVVGWGGDNPAGHGWSRFTEGKTWVSGGTADDYVNVDVTSDGFATLVWFSMANAVSQTVNLADGTVDPEAVLTPPDIWGPFPVASLERMALLSVVTAGAAKELTVAWKTGSGWGAPQVLRSADEIESVQFDSDENGNIVTLWREGSEIWSRVYQRMDDEWTRASFVATATPDAIIGSPDITAGNVVVAISAFDPDPATWVAVYQAGVGWLEDSVVVLDGTWTGASVALSMDTLGNALACWHDEFRCRRFTAAGGWQPRMSVGGSVSAYGMWSAAQPDGTTLVVGDEVGETGTGDLAPRVVRFE